MSARARGSARPQPQHRAGSSVPWRDQAGGFQHGPHTLAPSILFDVQLVAVETAFVFTAFRGQLCCNSWDAGSMTPQDVRTASLRFPRAGLHVRGPPRGHLARGLGLCLSETPAAPRRPLAGCPAGSWICTWPPADVTHLCNGERVPAGVGRSTGPALPQQSNAGFREVLSSFVASHSPSGS